MEPKPDPVPASNPPNLDGSDGRQIPSNQYRQATAQIAAAAILAILTLPFMQMVVTAQVADPQPESGGHAALADGPDPGVIGEGGAERVPESPEEVTAAVEGAGASPEATVSEEAVGASAEEGSPEEDGAGRTVSRGTTSSRGGSRSPEPAPAPAPDQAPEASESAGDRIASIAQQYLGYRYAWGGSSPRTGFDCSGLTWYVYKEAGIDIPRDLRGQLNAGPRIGRDDLLPGDLVFFENTYIWGLSHSGLSLGGGRFIHSVLPGIGVQINSLSEGFWSSRFVGGSRPWARE